MPPVLAVLFWAWVLVSDRRHPAPPRHRARRRSNRRRPGPGTPPSLAVTARPDRAGVAAPSSADAARPPSPDGPVAAGVPTSTSAAEPDALPAPTTRSRPGAGRPARPARRSAPAGRRRRRPRGHPHARVTWCPSCSTGLADRPHHARPRPATRPRPWAPRLADELERLGYVAAPDQRPRGPGHPRRHRAAPAPSDPARAPTAATSLHPTARDGSVVVGDRPATDRSGSGLRRQQPQAELGRGAGRRWPTGRRSAGRRRTGSSGRR